METKIQTLEIRRQLNILIAEESFKLAKYRHEYTSEEIQNLNSDLDLLQDILDGIWHSGVLVYN